MRPTRLIAGALMMAAALPFNPSSLGRRSTGGYGFKVDDPEKVARSRQMEKAKKKKRRAKRAAQRIQRRTA